MRVFIVDDDPLVSMSLQVILNNDSDIEVVGTSESGAEAVSRVDELLPDVIVMDIRMDGMTGIEAAELILGKKPEMRILFLTTFLDDEYINRALSIGAAGYVLKQDVAGLPASVKAVYSGQSVFGSKIVEKLPDIMNRREKFDYGKYGITEKEHTLIELVADGLSNKEIAQKMFLSEGTVRNIMSSVLSKLDLRDRTQLACFYYQNEP